MGGNGGWPLAAAASLIAASVVTGSAPPAASAAADAPAPPRLGTTPGVVAPASNNVSLFYTGSDGAVYQAKLLPTRGGPVSLGGNVIGSPGPEFTPPGSLSAQTNLYVRGTDNELWLKQINPASTWNNLGLDGFKLTSKPSASAGALSLPGDEAEDIVARGTDGAVWDQESNYHGATPWVSRGGQVLAGTGPAVVNADGTVYVVAVGTDRALWVDSTTDGSTWSGWRSLGGQVIGDPGVASPSAGVAVAFVRGTNNAVWYDEFAGTTSGVSRGWHSLGGTVTSGVGATTALGGSTWVVVLGSDNEAWTASGVWPAVHGWSKAP